MNEESAKLTLSKFVRSVHYTERSDFSSTSPRWPIRLSWWTASRCPKPLISSKPVWSLRSECFCEIDRAPCAPGWKIGKLCSPPFVRACTPCSMRETYEQSTRGGCVLSYIWDIDALWSWRLVTEEIAKDKFSKIRPRVATSILNLWMTIFKKPEI